MLAQLILALPLSLTFVVFPRLRYISMKNIDLLTANIPLLANDLLNVDNLLMANGLLLANSLLRANSLRDTQQCLISSWTKLTSSLSAEAPLVKNSEHD